MDYFQYAVETGATDLHLSPGHPPAVRLQGQFQRLEYVLSPVEFHQILARVAPADSLTAVVKSDQNLAATIQGIRCRVHGYQANGHVHVAIRLFMSRPPGIDQLGFPSSVIRMMEQVSEGLVLIGGSTGTGKSTTLAAWLHHINMHKPCHVVTLEDPIEWVHEPICAQVDQREVGRDVTTFETGILSALRADPDVIVIGELRSLASIMAAVLAAETGHLVLATIHGNDAPLVLSRIISAVPSHDRDWFLHRLSAVLRAVFALRLVSPHVPPQSMGKHRINMELLLNSEAIAHLIRTGQLEQIQTHMQTGRSLGMMTFEQHLATLG
jgi:twitching motility protein PilT